MRPTATPPTSRTAATIRMILTMRLIQSFFAFAALVVSVLAPSSRCASGGILSDGLSDEVRVRGGVGSFDSGGEDCVNLLPVVLCLRLSLIRDDIRDA
jgi:hypothetical protein